MFSRILFFISYLVLNNAAQGQSKDNLHQPVVGLNSISKIDRLNNLSHHLIFQEVDSEAALKTARQAYAEAYAINYTKGMGVSLIMQSEAHGRLLGDMKMMEKISREAIEVLQKTNDQTNLSHAYINLGRSLIWQGKFDTASIVLDKAKKLAIAANDKNQLAWTYNTMGLGFIKNNQYGKGFENLIESQRIGKEIKDSFVTATALAIIARAFNYSGDPRKGLEYYNESLQYVNKSYFLIMPHIQDMGYAYMQLNMLDSASYFYNKHIQNIDSVTTDKAVKRNCNKWVLPDFTLNLQLARKEYDQLIQKQETVLSKEISEDNLLHFMNSSLYVAKAYAGKKDYYKALKHALNLSNRAQTAGNQFYMSEAYKLLSSLYNFLGKHVSAYNYLTKHISIQEELDKEQFQLKTSLYAASSEAEKKYQLLKKDKELQENHLLEKEMQLKKQSEMKNLLAVCIILVLLFSFVFYRNLNLKRKNESLQHIKDQLTLKRKALELEMQALRSQMNPHFIFNCLSAIDNLVQTHQTDKAIAYLSHFAKLIRGVLDSSKNNLIPFEKDLQILKLYLKMEQFRCNNKFSYEIDVDQKLLQGDYKVPPMIIQPFIENSIHHGLLNKQNNDRHLNVCIGLEDERIVYTVTDNGVGRKQASEIKKINKPLQQSYGISITKDRIHLHNRNGIDKDLIIDDLLEDGEPAGTRAIVKIKTYSSNYKLYDESYIGR
jgi:tetratricopeptide (TPR) repeat protein